VGVEGDAVDDRGDQSRVGEHRTPLAERKVGPDPDRRSLFAVGDDLEQQFGAARVDLDVAELVNLCGCPHSATSSASSLSAVIRVGSDVVRTHLRRLAIALGVRLPELVNVDEAPISIGHATGTRDPEAIEEERAAGR